MIGRVEPTKWPDPAGGAARPGIASSVGTGRIEGSRVRAPPVQGMTVEGAG
jgi:hypothetical protein